MTHGEILSRITNDVDTINQSLNQSLTQIIASVTAVIGIIVMMLTISWQLTLVALIVLPVSAGTVTMIVKNRRNTLKTSRSFWAMPTGISRKCSAATSL